eukprot:112582-Rhodomonas_salina.1
MAESVKEYEASGCTIRSLSTAFPVVAYARSVPHIPQHHTLAQYRTSCSSMREFSTALPVVVYARSVPHSA